MTYRAIGNSIVDQDGKQIAIVMPTNCSKRLARKMAEYAAQQANHAAQAKAASAQVKGGA